MNFSMVSSVCFCSSEAQEVLDAVNYLNGQEGAEAGKNEPKDKSIEARVRSQADQRYGWREWIDAFYARIWSNVFAR